MLTALPHNFYYVVPHINIQNNYIINILTSQAHLIRFEQQIRQKFIKKYENRTEEQKTLVGFLDALITRLLGYLNKP
jgi:hypothetical protein